MDITNKQGNSFMDTNIQNKVKDLLDKFRSGAISSEEFKELSAKINQSSEADLEFCFLTNGINSTAMSLYHKIK